MSETGNELQLGLTEIRAYQEQTYGTGPVGAGDTMTFLKIRY